MSQNVKPELVLVIHKKSNTRTHIMNFKEYEKKKDAQEFKSIWRIATDDETIAYQNKVGKKTINPIIKVEPKKANQSKEKLDFIKRDAKPKEKEIKNTDLKES